ncbi:MAG: hypothetical protein CME71_12660 [Halobacteriovorax sp.]|nr:hypothetical protein [Halobacteriovorax sp.]|tara:strand:- start:36 stop:338 length:303 start_codon:yes stop_codon:yes gene_type:complete
MKFPNQKEINDAVRNITEDDYTHVIDENASNVDKTKFELCQNFIAYLRLKNCSQAELARILRIDRSRVNWIVKCRIENFTIDKLYGLWNMLDPGFKLKAH